MEGRGPEPGPVRSSRYVLAEAKFATDLPDGLIFRNRVNPLTQKYFVFSEVNQVYVSSRPAPQRGVSRSSRTWARDVMDVPAARDERRRRGRQSRVVLAPRRWCQALRDVSRGEGMPDCFGKPAVTNACAFYHCTRGCGCAKHPAFPAPTAFEGETDAKLGQSPAARMWCRLFHPVIASERSNPGYLRGSSLDFLRRFAPRNDEGR
jgi:hypothetical protein